MDVDPRPNIDAMNVDWSVVPWLVKAVAVLLVVFFLAFWLSVFSSM